MFESIPQSLEFLFNLKTLNFANNKLSTLPDYLARFSLSSLILSNNNLSGKIPENILTKTILIFYSTEIISRTAIFQHRTV